MGVCACTEKELIIVPHPVNDKKPVPANKPSVDMSKSWFISTDELAKMIKT